MKKQSINLEASLRELSAIVAWFEKQEEVDVEKGLKKVKRGAELVRSSQERLNQVENEFKEVKADLEKGGTEREE